MFLKTRALTVSGLFLFCLRSWDFLLIEMDEGFCCLGKQMRHGLNSGYVMQILQYLCLGCFQANHGAKSAFKRRKKHLAMAALL
jgi:hypothetical protein